MRAELFGEKIHAPSKSPRNPGFKKKRPQNRGMFDWYIRVSTQYLYGIQAIIKKTPQEILNFFILFKRFIFTVHLTPGRRLTILNSSHL
jgi:hypothetical protein